MQRDFAPVHVTAAFCTLHEPHDHRRCVDNTRGGGWCTASMLHATARDSCTRNALQSPHSHDPPAFWPVLRHARDDASCTTASREPGIPTFSAWLMRRLISAASRLLSSPVTRSHLGHSAQAFWAGSKSWHTFCAHALRPRRSETC